MGGAQIHTWKQDGQTLQFEEVDLSENSCPACGQELLILVRGAHEGCNIADCTDDSVKWGDDKQFLGCGTGACANNFFYMCPPCSERVYNADEDMEIERERGDSQLVKAGGLKRKKKYIIIKRPLLVDDITTN